MPFKLSLSVFLFLLTSQSIAQKLQIFDVTFNLKNQTDTFAFISLSDSYNLSENFDSLAIPSLEDEDISKAKDFEYIKLDGSYRKLFLDRTKVSESDNVFIYSYSKNRLISLPVSSLTVVACLNMYGGDWPYKQFDYMIGFEIDTKLISEYGTNMVSIGKKSPFVLNQLKPITWTKIDANLFPKNTSDSIINSNLFLGDTYTYESNGLQYFTQDFLESRESIIAVKQLLVIDCKTKKIVCKKQYDAGESTSIADLNEQWTGNLFKNESPVIFGFLWPSFGCPSITFLYNSANELYINCDNRH